MTDTTRGIPRYRAREGPALLGAGFRPFFQMAGLWAALAVPLWLAVLAGKLALRSAFDPVAWTAAFLLYLAVYGPMLLRPRAGR